MEPSVMGGDAGKWRSAPRWREKQAPPTPPRASPEPHEEAHAVSTPTAATTTTKNTKPASPRTVSPVPSPETISPVSSPKTTAAATESNHVSLADLRISASAEDKSTTPLTTTVTTKKKKTSAKEVEAQTKTAAPADPRTATPAVTPATQRDTTAAPKSTTPAAAKSTATAAPKTATPTAPKSTTEAARAATSLAPAAKLTASTTDPRNTTTTTTTNTITPNTKPSPSHPQKAWQDSWRKRGVPTHTYQHRAKAAFRPDSRPLDRLNHLRPAEEEEGRDAAAIAMSQNRRIYIGNLAYSAKPDVLERLLRDKGLGSFEQIHISIDSFSGRNPGYCFVDFPDSEAASEAIERLRGQVLCRRELKTGACEPKGRTLGGRRTDSEDNSAFNRWGNWKTQDGSGEGRGWVGRPPNQGEQPSSGTTLNRFGQRENFEGKRLRVGGLPRMHDQALNWDEMKHIFREFKMEGCSKRVTAHESKAEAGHHGHHGGRHDFCFVDFASPAQAEAAAKACDGVMFRGERIRVSVAKCTRRFNPEQQ